IGLIVDRRRQLIVLGRAGWRERRLGRRGAVVGEIGLPGCLGLRRADHIVALIAVGRTGVTSVRRQDQVGLLVARVGLSRRRRWRRLPRRRRAVGVEVIHRQVDALVRR